MTKLKDYHFFFLWFGAGISLSEILTGTILAPLGLWEAITVIILGHLIGSTLLVLGGMIGTRENQTAIGSTQAAFGEYGKVIMAALNVVQLLGWTAIMLKTGGEQINVLSKELWGYDALPLWIIAIGLIISIWIASGRAGTGAINTIAVGLLLILSVVVFWQVFSQVSFSHFTDSDGSMSFGAGLELTIVMPLSWLPVIADYNRRGHSPKKVAVGSWLGYTIGSSWMYIIGLLLSLTLKSVDLGGLLAGAGLSLAALGVIGLSTVTTTFLDTHSTGISFTNILPNLKAKYISLIIAVVGIVFAIILPMSRYESFLYLIGSFFSPLYAIVLCRYFILKKKNQSTRLLELRAFIIWLVGVGFYYLFIQFDLPCGATLPSMGVTGVIYYVSERMVVKWQPTKQSMNLLNK